MTRLDWFGVGMVAGVALYILVDMWESAMIADCATSGAVLRGNLLHALELGSLVFIIVRPVVRRG